MVIGLHVRPRDCNNYRVDLVAASDADTGFMLLCSDFTCEHGICYGSASVCSRPIRFLLSQTGILHKWMIRSPAFYIEARPTLTGKFWTWKNLSAVHLLV